MRLSFLILLCVLFALPARAAELDIERFMQLPILHEGRIKPMESFARANLKQFSGRDYGADIWLIETLFNPATSESARVLKVKNPAVLNFLELPKRESKLYSPAEIMSALGAHQKSILSIIELPEDEWSPEQADIITLQKNTVLLGDLLNSLSLFLPLSITLNETKDKDFRPYSNQVLSYLDTLKFSEALERNVKEVITRKGEDIGSYNQNEQTLAYLSFAAAQLRQSGTRSSILKVIPLGNNEWAAPWHVVSESLSTPETQTLLKSWKALAQAYHTKDTAAWDTALTTIQTQTLNLSGDSIRSHALKIESLYNALRPFHISTMLYGLALLLLLGEMISKRFHFPKAALAALSLGAVFHVAGLCARVYILARPPVSTLYESIIFVGALAVVYTLIAFIRERKAFWLYIAAGLGIVLHLIGFSHQNDGDNMMMLSAVLNTNFWLATHVICITAAYGFCVITVALAHYALIKDIVIGGLDKPTKPLFATIHTLALITLLLATVGTVLGGIWADQSWGRFWGWDPKENGAMLICLWLIWLVHGRISGQMSRLHVTLGLAYLSVILALSWFGVNMLSVGLHSYGFTHGAAYSLGAFILGETAFILLISALLLKRKNAHV